MLYGCRRLCDRQWFPGFFLGLPCPVPISEKDVGILTIVEVWSRQLHKLCVFGLSLRFYKGQRGESKGAQEHRQISFMSKPLVLRSSSSARRQPLLKSESSASTSSWKSRVAEISGGTAAECAAICCCCPCGLANFLVLAIYKVPAGLCRRALRKKRRANLIKKGLWPPSRHRCPCGCDETEIQIHPMTFASLEDVKGDKMGELDEEAEKLEKEMWDLFYGSGFWRSPSQRESP